MDTDTATLTDAALLQLIWLASPALPVGGFSYSEGLEAAVESERVLDEQGASDWLVDQLHLTLARGDLAVVASAAQAAREGNVLRLAELDEWVRCTRESSELRQQTEQMGRSLGEWQKSLHPVRAELVEACAPASTSSARTDGGSTPTDGGSARTDGGSARTHGGSARTDGGSARTDFAYPVAFAVAAARTTASARQIALAFAFSWAENMMQSAIKAVPLGHGAGQRILARLAAEIPAAVDHALALDDRQRQAFSPMLAILSAQHETQYSRLFRS